MNYPLSVCYLKYKEQLCVKPQYYHEFIVFGFVPAPLEK